MVTKKKRLVSKKKAALKPTKTGQNPRKKPQEIQFLGFHINQKDNKEALPFFCFVATADSVLGWARTEATATTPGGAQRLLSESHRDQIRRFMKADPSNIIPTAVTLSLDAKTFSLSDVPLYKKGDLPAGVTAKVLTVSIPIDKPKPGRVLDGQHRLMALSGTTHPLVFTVILGADAVERAVQFVVINNKQKRVPTDLVKAIQTEMTDGEQGRFDERLRSARVTLGSYTKAVQILATDSRSPFYAMVNWDINREGEHAIKPAALEAGIRALKSIDYEMDLDECADLFMSIWRGVKGVWQQNGQDWSGDGAKNLLSKAALVAVTEFYAEQLQQRLEEGNTEFLEPSNAETLAGDIFRQIPIEFWTKEWAPKSLDTSAGRGLIRDAMKKVRTAHNMSHPLPLSRVPGFFL